MPRKCSHCGTNPVVRNKRGKFPLFCGIPCLNADKAEREADKRKHEASSPRKNKCLKCKVCRGALVLMLASPKVKRVRVRSRGAVLIASPKTAAAVRKALGRLKPQRTRRARG